MSNGLLWDPITVFLVPLEFPYFFFLLFELMSEHSFFFLGRNCRNIVDLQQIENLIYVFQYSLLSEIKVLEADMLDLPFSNECFDVVIEKGTMVNILFKMAFLICGLVSSRVISYYIINIVVTFSPPKP